MEVLKEDFGTSMKNKDPITLGDPDNALIEYLILSSSKYFFQSLYDNTLKCL